MLSPDLLALLRCPLDASHTSLAWKASGSSVSACRLVFPLRDGFPTLLVEEAELPPGCPNLEQLPCQRRSRLCRREGKSCLTIGFMSAPSAKVSFVASMAVKPSAGPVMVCSSSATSAPLAVDPRDERRLYLGSEEGLFFSSNGADDWQRIDSPLNGLQIWSLLLHPANPDLLLAGTCPSRLFRSADGGRTWTEPAAEMEQFCPRIIATRVTTLAADPGDPAPSGLGSRSTVSGAAAMLARTGRKSAAASVRRTSTASLSCRPRRDTRAACWRVPTTISTSATTRVTPGVR